MLQRKHKFRNIEPCPLLREPRLLLQMPKQLPTTLKVCNQIQFRIRLEAKLERHKERAFEAGLKDFAFADGMRHFLLCDNFALGEDFHSVYALSVFLANLEDAAKGTTANEFEEFEIARCKSSFGLFHVICELYAMWAQTAMSQTLYCSYVIWTRISPVMVSPSRGKSLKSKR